MHCQTFCWPGALTSVQNTLYVFLWLALHQRGHMWNAIGMINTYIPINQLKNELLIATQENMVVSVCILRLHSMLVHCAWSKANTIAQMRKNVRMVDGNNTQQFIQNKISSEIFAKGTQWASQSET